MPTKKRVICSECGEEFLVDTNGGFDPEACPSCGKTIQSVESSALGDTDVAWVE